jgi:subtilisin family serine protease
MKTKNIFIVVIVLISISFFSFIENTGPKYKMMNEIVIKRLSDGALYQKGVINIKFKNHINFSKGNSFNITTIDKILNQYNVNKLSQWFKLNPDVSKRKIGDEELAKIYIIRFDGNIDPTDLSKEIMDKNSSILDWAEPEFVMVSDFTPNDPLLSSQWFLTKISAYTAWDLCQGDTTVVIAMIDTGGDLDHPDLAANTKINYAENPTNGIDDDNNGYIDDWRGWDFAGANYLQLSEDNDPNIYSVYCEHGSHTSGCASEVTNNSTGGAGIGFKCKLLICKHGADNDNTGGGYSYLYNTNNGLNYAYQNGAKIMNCSYGSSQFSAMTQLIITNAWSNGVVTCASAGNEGQNIARYPASYNYVVSVAATTSSDIKASFSNYHSTVDVCAPGTSIRSTVWNNTYTYMDGTSMSSPITAGTVALIRSRFPYFTPQQVVDKLKLGVDSIYNLNPTYIGLLGTGRINAYKCVFGTPTGVINWNQNIPSNFKLEQNFPNPFNPFTVIRFSIPAQTFVNIEVFDAVGRKMETLINKNLTPGNYETSWDASKYSSGVYFYKIKAGEFIEMKKMILNK